MGLDSLEYKKVYISGVDNLVQDFYIPTLSESILYQRKTGYFNSRALAMAARGISGLLKNNGKMQLLCSVILDAEDKIALQDPHQYLQDHEERLIEQLHRPYDELEKKRLGLLAELQARGALEIRICVKQGGIYHEKTGIFTDRKGNHVVFTGSGNETPGGWIKNMENFTVFTSWESPEYAEEHRAIFERQWRGEFPTLQTYPVSQAIYQEIARFQDYFEEGVDEPIDPPDKAAHKESITWEWTPELAYIAEAQRLWNYRDFAYGETAVTPYEHQDYIATKALSNWPPRYILCDEVGLGKTIEAGLIIKGFVASGHVGRLLILAPKHVLQQWQQELYSKFRLKVWLLDGNYVYGPKFHPDEEPEKEPVNPENPFATKNMMLVSSQLARLDPRQEQLLQRHYDLIVVDEAHHARATYDGMSRKPNKLLNLLQNLRYQTQGLLLLTATPIQVDRRELWDLLNILELPGKWQDPDLFNAFIEALDTEPTDWGFLLSMASDYYPHLEDPAALTKNIEQDHPDVKHFKLLDIIAKQKVQEAYQLSDHEKEVLKLMLYRCTPIRDMAFRHSRELLKEYKKQGKFHGKIAEREPHPIKIELSGSEDDETSEKGLYKRIEKYVKKYYGKYKGIRQGLGFVMVIYRKRLTSSFEAIKISLQRRYEKLEEALATGDPSVLFAGLLAPEGSEWEDLQGLVDIEEEDLELVHDDVSAALKVDEIVKRLLTLVEEEHSYLEGFLHDLKNLTTDSKFEDFRERLRDLTRKGVQQIIVFSQFKDTVDYLKNRFVPVFKERIGTYTGAGGEYYKDGAWHTCSKQEIQAKFRDEHDPLSILFCTDAASESLNLQTCSHLFNYDIPWNPMRIEQRIGRVDRIGQKADIVHVYTYSYKDTVEERAYYRCLERINYFRTTLGYLQPILDATRKAIHEATMEGDESREEEIIEKYFRNVAEIEEEKTIQYLLNTYEPEFKKLKEKVPITQNELEQILSEQLEKNGWMKKDSFWMKNSQRITFELAAFDQKGEKAELVTYQTNLSQLFGSLPPIPDQLTDRNSRVRKITAKGYTGFLVQANSGYRLARRISDLKGMHQGRVYHSVEEAQQELEKKILRSELDRLNTWGQIWDTRYNNWKTRVKMYLDKLFVYTKEQEIKPGSLEGFGEDVLIGRWQKYLGDARREELKKLAEYIQYKPDPSIKIGQRRGRKSQRSPRDSEKEKRLLQELRTIRENQEKIKENKQRLMV